MRVSAYFFLNADNVQKMMDCSLIKVQSMGKCTKPKIYMMISVAGSKWIWLWAAQRVKSIHQTVTENSSIICLCQIILQTSFWNPLFLAIPKLSEKWGQDEAYRDLKVKIGSLFSQWISKIRPILVILSYWSSFKNHTRILTPFTLYITKKKKQK